jgi:hypothetical protein
VDCVDRPVDPIVDDAYDVWPPIDQ